MNTLLGPAVYSTFGVALRSKVVPYRSTLVLVTYGGVWWRQRAPLSSLSRGGREGAAPEQPSRRWLPAVPDVMLIQSRRLNTQHHH